MHKIALMGVPEIKNCIQFTLKVNCEIKWIKVIVVKCWRKWSVFVM